MVNSYKILSIVVLMVLSSLLVIGLSGDSVEATTFTEGHFTYTIIDADGVRIDSYDLDTGQLTIPDSVLYDSQTYYVKKIGDSAFYNRSNLYGEIVLPHKLEVIGVDAFNFCKGLYGPLNLPDSVRYIGDRAFYECSGFTSLDLPDTLDYLGESAFCGCSALSGNLVLPTGITSIPTFAFMNCMGFSGTLSIPVGVSSIDKMAFRFTCFDRVVFPSSLKVIGSEAFSSATIRDGQIQIPGSVESIGSQAFYYVDLYNITIKEGVKSIGTECFAPLSRSIEYVSLPSSLTGLSPNSFSDTIFYSEDGSEVLSQTVSQLAGHSFTLIDGKLLRDASACVVILDCSPISSCSLNGSGRYLSGSTISISASPYAGYAFKEWSDGVKDPVRTIVVDKDITLTAICDESVTLSLSYSPLGSGSVKGAGSYAKGSTVEISATPYSQYVFKEWSDGVKDPVRTIVLDNNLTLTALFYSAHFVYFDVNGGSQQMSPQSVLEGGEFIVPDYSGLKDGYVFSCWSYDGVEEHAGDKIIMGDQDIYLLAVWESDKSSSGDSTLLIAICAVAVVIGGILIVVFIKRRV